MSQAPAYGIDRTSAKVWKVVTQILPEPYNKVSETTLNLLEYLNGNPGDTNGDNVIDITKDVNSAFSNNQLNLDLTHINGFTRDLSDWTSTISQNPDIDHTDYINSRIMTDLVTNLDPSQSGFAYALQEIYDNHKDSTDAFSSLMTAIPLLNTALKWRVQLCAYLANNADKHSKSDRTKLDYHNDMIDYYSDMKINVDYWVGHMNTRIADLRQARLDQIQFMEQAVRVGGSGDITSAPHSSSMDGWTYTDSGTGNNGEGHWDQSKSKVEKNFKAAKNAAGVIFDQQYFQASNSVKSWSDSLTEFAATLPDDYARKS